MSKSKELNSKNSDGKPPLKLMIVIRGKNDPDYKKPDDEFSRMLREGSGVLVPALLKGREIVVLLSPEQIEKSS